MTNQPPVVHSEKALAAFAAKAAKWGVPVSEVQDRAEILAVVQLTCAAHRRMPATYADKRSGDKYLAGRSLKFYGMTQAQAEVLAAAINSTGKAVIARVRRPLFDANRVFSVTVKRA